MNVLVTGNLGYVGSELTSYLKNKEKKINIYGLDIGYFKKNKTSKKKNKIKKQYICDIRNLFKIKDKKFYFRIKLFCLWIHKKNLHRKNKS